MATISFKADTEFKQKVDAIAHNRGINTSAFIKLVLTEKLKEELSRVTENGLTVAEELQLLRIAHSDEWSGPFDDANDLMKSLRK